MRNRRHVRVPPDLTSLFDVLFIVIFAALIRAAAAEKPKPPPPAPPVPAPVQLDPKSLQARAVTGIDAALRERPSVVLRVSAAGTLTALESGGKTQPLDIPLLEADPDSDVNVRYLGDRSVDLRLCRIAAKELGAADLAKYLIIVAPERIAKQLPEALFKGLTGDLDHCLAEQHGIATLVEPGPP